MARPTDEEQEERPALSKYDEEEREDGEGETLTRDAFLRDRRKGSEPPSEE